MVQEKSILDCKTLEDCVERLSAMARNTRGARFQIKHDEFGFWKVHFTEVKYMNEGLHFVSTCEQAIRDAGFNLIMRREVYEDCYTVLHYKDGPPKVDTNLRVVSPEDIEYVNEPNLTP